jgi:cell division protein ZapB
MLEGRIDQLIDYCLQLKEENSLLKSENQGLADERAQLVEKTKLARARIETMIGRLKALERG